MAMFNKGIALRDAGHSAKAVAQFGVVADRFREAADPAIRLRVATSLGEQGRVLRKLGRPAEVAQVTEELIRRFSASEEPAIQKGNGGGDAPPWASAP